MTHEVVRANSFNDESNNRSNHKFYKLSTLLRVNFEYYLIKNTYITLGIIRRITIFGVNDRKNRLVIPKYYAPGRRSPRSQTEKYTMRLRWREIRVFCLPPDSHTKDKSIIFYSKSRTFNLTCYPLKN